MRLILAPAALALLPAAAAMAQDGDVTCEALGLLVEFGMVDGGQGGDTGEFTAVVDSGDPALCGEWLSGYGYGTEGIALPECAEVIRMVGADGFPEPLWPEAAGMIDTALVSTSPEFCAQTLAVLNENG